MGKLFGFLEYARELPPDRDPLERLNDWNEIRGLLPQEEERRQAARCMACSVPFCHSGQMIGGLPSGCPLGNLIPEWNDLLYRGEWEGAAQRLLMTNSFPEFTGRVCPAPCEGACTCGIHQPQVTIRQNELSIIERAFADGRMQPRPPAVRTADGWPLWAADPRAWPAPSASTATATALPCWSAATAWGDCSPTAFPT